MPTPSRASASESHSTRFSQLSHTVALHPGKFNIAPAQRNTRGFQPRVVSQSNDKISPLPDPSMATSPKPSSNVTTESPSQSAPVAASVPAATEPEVAKAKGAEVTTNGVDHTNSGIDHSQPATVKPAPPFERVSAKTTAEDAKVYKASDEESSAPELTSRHPLTQRNLSAFLNPSLLHQRDSRRVNNTTNMDKDKKSPGKFDSSMSYAATMAAMPPPRRPHVEINKLHKFAWNGGVDPERQQQARAMQQTTAPVANYPKHRSDTPTPNAGSINKPSTRDDNPAKASTLGVTSPEQHSHREVKQETPLAKPIEERPATESHNANIVQTKAEFTGSQPSTGSGSVHHASARVRATQVTVPAVNEVTPKPQISIAFKAEMPEQDEPRGVSKYTPPHLRTPMPKQIQADISPKVPELQTPSSPYSHKASNGGVNLSEESPKGAKAEQSPLPPHLRQPKVEKPAVERELKPAVTPVREVSVDRNEVTKPSSNGVKQPAFSPSNGKAKAALAPAPANGGLDHATSSGNSLIAKAEAKKGRKLTNTERMMVKKGYTLSHGPLRVEGDWMKQLEENWEERSPHDYAAAEHAAKLTEWTNQLAEEIGPQPVVVDTTAPEFVQGTYVPVDERLEALIDEALHVTHRGETDEYTAKKLEKTAQEAMDAMIAKKALEEPEKKKLSREEYRQMLAVSRANTKRLQNMENEHPDKPTVDIYIRPLENADLPDVVAIYNWYIDNTPTMEFHHMSISEWRTKIEDIRSELFQVYVAVLRSGRIGGRRLNREPVVGFVYGEDLGGLTHGYRFTGQLQGPWVAKDYLRMGIGRALFDRQLECMDLNYSPEAYCPWRGESMMHKRELKKVYIELPYWNNTEEGQREFQWKKAFLTGTIEKYFRVKFDYVGSLTDIAFKQKKTVTIAQFIHDTQLDIANRDDPPKPWR